MVAQARHIFGYCTNHQYLRPLPWDVGKEPCGDLNPSRSAIDWQTQTLVLLRNPVGGQRNLTQVAQRRRINGERCGERRWVNTWAGQVSSCRGCCSWRLVLHLSLRRLPRRCFLRPQSRLLLRLRPFPLPFRPGRPPQLLHQHQSQLQPRRLGQLQPPCRRLRLCRRSQPLEVRWKSEDSWSVL